MCVCFSILSILQLCIQITVSDLAVAILQAQKKTYSKIIGQDGSSSSYDTDAGSNEKDPGQIISRVKIAGNPRARGGGRSGRSYAPLREISNIF